jgi:hypothetical protein
MAVSSARSDAVGLLTLSRRPGHSPVDGLRVAVAAGTAAAAAVGGVTLVLRRLAGGFAAPPTAASGWLVAAAGIGLIMAIDAATVRGWTGIVTRAALLAAAVAVTPFAGATTWPERLAALLPLAVAAIAVLTPRPRRSSRGAWQMPSKRAVIRRTPPSAPTRPPEPEPPAQPGLQAPAPPATSSFPEPPLAALRQRLERYETPAGADCLRGRAVLAVAVGSRTGFAHVGFCPSFAATPAVEVSTDYDGVEAELAVAEVLPWGVRLECRLAEPAEEPLDIPIDFLAHLAVRDAS